jgi:hypothetical protein
VLLLAALALFVLAAWLMLAPEEPRTRRSEIAFPRYPRPHELERQQRRRTLALPVESDSTTADAELGAGEPRAAPAPFDPVHVALPASELSIVVEAGVLKDSPVGRMLLACLSPEQSAELRELEQRTGFRPLDQLDRIALSGSLEDGGPLLVADGDFTRFDVNALGSGAVIEAVGRSGMLAEQGERALAVWDRRILVLGTTEGVRAALARLEGEGKLPASNLSDEAYGEIYGSLSAQMLSQLLPAELGGRLRGAAERVLLHVDATEDLVVVAEVHGEREQELSDLGMAIAGALSVGRLQAVRERDALLAELLDESRVVPGDTSFQLEMALPLATIERQLGACARDVD